MRHILFAALLMPIVVAACSSSSATSGDVSADASNDSASSDSASSDSATCTGTPPVVCDGCCGRTYPADECLDGVWSCRSLGGACAVCDAGVKDSEANDAAAEDASGDVSTVHDASADAGTCTGSAPLCFGNNASDCCGNDPAGSASCNSGEWMCGAAPAPGCNGTSCLIHDAGPG